MEKAMGYRKPGTRLEKKAAHPLADINDEEAITLDRVGSFILVYKIVLIVARVVAIAKQTSQQQGPLHLCQSRMDFNTSLPFSH
jgi:hypothetical protein